MNVQTRAEAAGESKLHDALFRLITEEIKDLNEAERLRGWTPWVITASLVSISWIVVQDLWAGTYNYRLLQLIFLAVSTCLVLGIVIKKSLSDYSTKGPFSLLYANSSALTSFVAAAWTGLVAFEGYSLWQVHGRAVFLVASGWFGIGSVALFIGSVLIFVRFPLPVLSKTPKKTALVAIFHLGVYTATLIEIVRLDLISGATSTEIKIGGLLALGAFGFVILAGSGNQNPLRQTLVGLRRDLILEDIPASEALQRTRSVLQGMWLSDIASENMQALFKLISDVRAEHEEALRKISTLKQSIQASSLRGTQIPEVEKLAIASTLDILREHENRVHEMSHKYYKLLGSMRVRLKIAARANRDASSDEKNLLAEVRQAQEPVDALLHKFARDYHEVQSAWNQLFPEEQRNHRPFNSSPEGYHLLSSKLG